MSIIDKVKESQLNARKDREKRSHAASLTTLIGEAEAIGKNAGNRAPTDLEVVAVIKKFIKNIDDSCAHAERASMGSAVAAYKEERELYCSFLPSQLTDEELVSVVNDIITEVGPKLGVVMKVLKDRHNGTYDGSKASSIVKTAVNNTSIN